MSEHSHLLKHIRNAAAKLNEDIDRPDHKEILANVDILINELMLNEDVEFYAAMLREGRQLADEAHMLLRGRSPDADEPVESGRDEPTANYQAVKDALDSVEAELSLLVRRMDEERYPQDKALLNRMGDWEKRVYMRTLEEVNYTPLGAAPAITREGLEAYLRRTFPDWTDLEVTDFRIVDGGYSKKTILFDTMDAVNGRQSLVLRADQPVAMLRFSNVAAEFTLIGIMRRTGLPIPEAIWLEQDVNALGAPFILSRRAPGVTLRGTMQMDVPVPPALLQSFLDTFIALQKARLDADDPLVRSSLFAEWLPHKSVSDTIRHYVTAYLPNFARASGVPISPQMARALAWLERNVPECADPPVLIHADFNFNNLLVEGDRITAILDWESVRFGDPVDEIIWTQQQMADCLSMPDFLAHVERETGRTISPYRIAYARVARCVLDAIICQTALRSLRTHDAAPLRMARPGYRFLPMLGTLYSDMIAAAEAAKAADEAVSA